MATEIVTNGDVELVCDVDGEGPAVLLLHGWPDSAALWRDVAPRLVDAGHRVVVPDLRGCGRSSKPEDVASYRMQHLVTDVAAIITQLCDGRAHLCGHDWGANLAWVTAAYLPANVDRLVVVSVGHPASFRTAGIEQQARSWYMLLFEHERIAETWLTADDFRAFREWTGHPDAEGVIESITANGSLTTHLNWYRANVSAATWIAPPPRLPPVQPPTLGVWSSGDLALTEAQMTGSAQYCENGFEYVRLEGLGHWIPLERPEQLAGLASRFYAGPSS